MEQGREAGSSGSGCVVFEDNRRFMFPLDQLQRLDFLLNDFNMGTDILSEHLRLLTAKGISCPFSSDES